jgi:hypothetical protein
MTLISSCYDSNVSVFRIRWFLTPWIRDESFPDPSLISDPGSGTFFWDEIIVGSGMKKCDLDPGKKNLRSATLKRIVEHYIFFYDNLICHRVGTGATAAGATETGAV